MKDYTNGFKPKTNDIFGIYIDHINMIMPSYYYLNNGEFRPIFYDTNNYYSKKLMDRYTIDNGKKVLLLFKMLDENHAEELLTGIKFLLNNGPILSTWKEVYNSKSLERLYNILKKYETEPYYINANKYLKCNDKLKLKYYLETLNNNLDIKARLKTIVNNIKDDFQINLDNQISKSEELAKVDDLIRKRVL